MATYRKSRPTADIDEDSVIVRFEGPVGARTVRVQAATTDGKVEIDETYGITASQAMKIDGTALAGFDPSTSGTLAQKLRQLVRAVLADKGFAQV